MQYMNVRATFYKTPNGIYYIISKVEF